jgi:POT family proton-dependent oligopeptide transporter
MNIFLINGSLINFILVNFTGLNFVDKIMSATSSSSPQKELFGHPMGLYVLFFTEMWERFSYYGMRAILVLYMVSQTTDSNAGLGWTDGDALALYGWYTMLVYVASIPGGIIADKLIGQKKSVLIGGLLLCVGHGVLAIEEMWAFYTGLGLIIAGVGLLKPNISTMVGGLYKQGDIRRDKGFTIFYIGINIGAFLSSLIVGYVGEVHGWHYGFGLAGIGMLLGQAVYMLGQKHLKEVGNFIGKSEDPAVKAAAKKPLTKIEKDRVIVLFLSFLIVIVFWGAFEQAGGLMNIYTMEKTNRMFMGTEIPASVFQSLNAMFIILFGTLIASFWAKRKLKSKESSSLFKMAIGTIIMGSGFLFMTAAAGEYEATGSSAMYWLVLAYLLHTIGELCASPVALSFITKLAPLKYSSIMMGVYFAMTGFGNKLAGLLGESASSLGEYTIFTGIAVFCAVFGLLILALLKKLKGLTHGAEDNEGDIHESEGYDLAEEGHVEVE